MTKQRTITPLRNLAGPLILGGLLLLIYLILGIQAPRWFDSRFRTYLLVALAAALGEFCIRSACYLLLDVIFRKRQEREAPALLRMVIYLVGYSALFVVVYSFVLDRSLSGVWTTSAVLSVILGLALQDTLGNFFAGISLHVEQPFHIGDAVRMGDMIGRVESITWRTTALRTNNNALIVLPNSRIARDPIEIHSLNVPNRCILRIPAPYSISPETVMSLLRDGIGSVAHVSPDKTPVVRIAEFGESGIVYEALYWVTDYLLMAETDAAIRERVWYMFRRNCIEIPFPIRNILFEQKTPAPVAAEDDGEKELERLEILRPLSPSERKSLAKGALRHIYGPGEIVLRYGDEGDSMFVIRRGRAEVAIGGDKGGLSHEVAQLAESSVFGEMGLFTGEPRKADVRALGELEVMEIRKPALESLLLQNEKLVEAFSTIIAARQAHLTSLSQAVPEAERSAQRETILRRMQRFFGISKRD